MIDFTILGVPSEDQHLFQRWSKVLVDIVTEEQYEQSMIEFMAYLESLIHQRRSEPKEDLLTDLILAEEEGERLSVRELYGVVIRRDWMIEAQALTLNYGERNIIEDLQLEIPTGKITVLVGANGCGKSTLLRALARLMKPATGVISLDGREMKSMTTKEIARKLAVLPQGPIHSRLSSNNGR